MDSVGEPDCHHASLSIIAATILSHDDFTVEDLTSKLEIKAAFPEGCVTLGGVA